MTDYGDLSTTELAKQINAEYAAILDSERTNFQRWLSLGEKLIALRPRIAPKHGEWQAKLKLHCPTISYEKANLCIRFAENRDKLEAYAASKNVKVTDLGIDEGRKALAKPKSTDNASKSGSVNKPSKAVKAGVEPAIDPPSRKEEDVAKEWMRPLEFDELAIVLKEVFDADYLSKLARAIAPTQPPQGQASMRPSLATNAGIERRA
jgi:hypothetical protein